MAMLRIDCATMPLAMFDLGFPQHGDMAKPSRFLAAMQILCRAASATQGPSGWPPRVQRCVAERLDERGLLATAAHPTPPPPQLQGLGKRCQWTVLCHVN